MPAKFEYPFEDLSQRLERMLTEMLRGSGAGIHRPHIYRCRKDQHGNYEMLVSLKLKNILRSSKRFTQVVYMDDPKNPQVFMPGIHDHYTP